MQNLTAEAASKLSLSEARNMAFEANKQVQEFSKLLFLSEALNKKLESRLAELMNELGAKNQQVMLTAEQINQLRAALFASSSERRPDSELPLFNKKSSELETVQRKKRTEFGRKEQPKLPEVEVPHELSAEEMQAQGLKKWEGQFEISELITVSPSRIILEIHKRQKYLRDTSVTPATESSSDQSPIVTAPGPLKLKEGSRYSIARSRCRFANSIFTNRHHCLVLEAYGFSRDCG